MASNGRIFFHAVYPMRPRPPTCTAVGGAGFRMTCHASARARVTATLPLAKSKSGSVRVQGLEERYIGGLPSTDKISI